jgi:predicted nucleotidyltransferase
LDGIREQLPDRIAEGATMSADVDSLIERAAAVLRSAGASEVYLFGSAATEKMRFDSDVDIAVSGLPPGVFFRAMSDAESALGRPLDLIDLDEDSPFTRYLKSEGELRRVG